LNTTQWNLVVYSPVDLYSPLFPELHSVNDLFMAISHCYVMKLMHDAAGIQSARFRSPVNTHLRCD